jgi:flagellar biosynthetic protein FliR
MLATLLTEEVFAFALVFARLGAALMLLPTVGEAAVPARVRLHFALAFTVVLTPLLAAGLPAPPAGALSLFVMLLGEVVIGLFIGASARVVMAALHVAGMAFSFHSGLAAAQMFDPNQAMRTSISGNFLNLLALMVIFVSDLHHLLLAGLVDSYALFPAGSPWPAADGADAIAHLVADTFRVGLQIAAPVLVAGFLLYLGAGLLNRLMPQMMVFFVVLPMQIMLGFAILMVSLAAALGWFARFFDSSWLALTTPG